MRPIHVGDHILTSSEKHILDLLSVATVVASLTEFLPHVAAGFTVLWTAIRIWETDTVQGLFGRTKTGKDE